MKLLAIDTSTERASIALLYDGNISCEEHQARQQHAQLILPTIDALLLKAGVSLNQLDGIVFGQGPGSFTGLRIACNVAKGLAYAYDLPIFPVSTLKAIANELIFQRPDLSHHNVLSMMDARMNQVYWALYSADSESLNTEQVSNIADIKPKLDEALVLAGIGYDGYCNQLADSVVTRITEYIEIYPKATAMLRIAASRKIAPVSAKDALPLYVRNQVV